jgi:glyoxylase-like metal-dependent hydrolase (beta-lactamase superfamily II)
MTPREIAPGVYWLPLGKGLRASNVYFVRSDSSWSLIDAGWAKDAPAIRRAAESLFGRDTPPASILLTHDHPDHAGAVRELAQLWALPAWVHPRELPLALGDVQAVHEYAGPLDRWVILPAMRLTGSKRMAATLLRTSLKGMVRAFQPEAGPPGLTGWEALSTPGHTPGHVACVRREDRVAITGDALVTIDLNSLRRILLSEPRVAGPPWYTTWDRRAAKASAVALANLGPRVIAGGHGFPMTGLAAREGLRGFFRRLGA